MYKHRPIKLSIPRQHSIGTGVRYARPSDIVVENRRMNTTGENIEKRTVLPENRYFLFSSFHGVTGLIPFACCFSTHGSVLSLYFKDFFLPQ